MHLLRAPCRIILFGAEVCCPSNPDMNVASVVGGTINKFTSVYLFEKNNDFAGGSSRKKSNHIFPPSLHENEKLLDLVLTELDAKNAFNEINIRCSCDLPYYSGIGARTALISATVRLVSMLLGMNLSRNDRDILVGEIQTKVGSIGTGFQDAFIIGHERLVWFSADGANGFRNQSIDVPHGRLDVFEKHLMLLYSGRHIKTSTEGSSFDARNEEEMRKLEFITPVIDEAISVFEDTGSDIKQLGILLDECWEYNRQFSDEGLAGWMEIYRRAKTAGAIGGKILGGSCGSFLLLFVEPSARYSVKKSLNEFIEVPFSFNQSGSKNISGD